MFRHMTVLLQEAVDGLNVRPSGVYVDCTLGGAGHSEFIASKLETGRLIAFDQDETAIRHARERLAPYVDRVSFVNRNFRMLREELLKLDVPQRDGLPQVDGLLFDLGVSSPQLDEAERGFSYQHDAPLDMRMDRGAGLTAHIVVNEWPEEHIARILAEYGEEKFARRIAGTIARKRLISPIETTSELAELVKEAIPAAARRTGPHPARRSFQAIRIAVNDELGALRDVLEQAISCLAPGGRLSVITFHSLEDRICKQFFAKFVEACTCPPDFPICVCRKQPEIRLITKKPIVAGEQELEANPRSRSAKLRIIEKL